MFLRFVEIIHHSSIEKPSATSSKYDLILLSPCLNFIPSPLNIVNVSTTRMEIEDVVQFGAINPVHHDEIKVKSMSDVLSKTDVYQKPSLGKRMGNFITKIGGGLVDRAVESLLLAL
jgi:hypothetical protein